MNWIADPGHAWLKVPVKKLLELNIADKISGYSYLRGEYAYLEEDMDAYTFLQAVGKKPDDYKSTHTNKDSRVRSYYSYSYDQAMRHLQTAQAYKSLVRHMRGGK